jgi:translation initiation factor IF-3
LSRPFSPRSPASPASFVRINGKIRAREVRVIGDQGKQLGVMSLTDAINLARNQGVDLVEIAPNAVPPVCRVVDFGKYRYEQAKKEKESKKHQHANKIKEIQLSPKIDPHDLGIKTTHAVDFLCEDMKVKVSLKFRGREMAHKEFGFEVIKKLIAQVAPFGHPDFEPKLVGRGIHVMITPLPRNKRAKNPRELADGSVPVNPNQLREEPADDDDNDDTDAPATPPAKPAPTKPTDGFANNPFGNIEIK